MHVLVKIMFTYVRSFLWVGGWLGEGFVTVYIYYFLWVWGWVRWLSLIGDAISFNFVLTPTT